MHLVHNRLQWYDILKTIKFSRFNKSPEFNIHGSVHRNNILICIQQNTTLHSLLYLETALYVSGGTTTHHQERKQLYLQHLAFVTPLLLPAAIVEELELVSVCCGGCFDQYATHSTLKPVPTLPR
jgi:hypothetical protein